MKLRSWNSKLPSVGMPSIFEYALAKLCATRVPSMWPLAPVTAAQGASTLPSKPRLAKVSEVAS